MIRRPDISTGLPLIYGPLIEILETIALEKTPAVIARLARELQDKVLRSAPHTQH